MTNDVLSSRQLNRALLERQLLLRRTSITVSDAIEHLVGQQAQVPTDPYLGLWSRLDGFRPDDLATMLEDRRAVRAALMRATIHLVTATDLLSLRPLMQPVLDRTFRSGSPFKRRLEGVDVDAVVKAGRRLVEERPRTRVELSASLAERWPDADAEALAYAVTYVVPLVQVPPRGVWGKSGQATWTSAETWLGESLASDPSVDDLVLRYLAAFGPASVMDMQSWSGLTRLREVFERLRHALRPFRTEAGREVFDLPVAPRPDADTPAPPRFLPEYDNVLLGHADRTRIVSDELRRQVTAAAGARTITTFLLDGRGGGTWTIRREDDAAVLVIEPAPADGIGRAARLAARDRSDLIEEGARLLAFSAPDATTYDVRVG